MWPEFHTIATAGATVKAVTTVAIATAPAKALATEVIATASMASTASVCFSRHLQQVSADVQLF